jgi:hypothetical protein
MSSNPSMPVLSLLWSVMGFSSLLSLTSVE